MILDIGLLKTHGDLDGEKMVILDLLVITLVVFATLPLSHLNE